MTVIDLDAVIDLKASSGGCKRHPILQMPKTLVCIYLFINIQISQQVKVKD